MQEAQRVRDRALREALRARGYAATRLDRLPCPRKSLQTEKNVWGINYRLQLQIPGLQELFSVTVADSGEAVNIFCYSCRFVGGKIIC